MARRPMGSAIQLRTARQPEDNESPVASQSRQMAHVLAPSSVRMQQSPQRGA